MTEVWFYHLRNQPLARALPKLVEKALERGRVAIQTGSEADLKVIDDLLWTHAAESFLPHGLARDKDAERQPIILTHESDNPNAAAMRFFIGGAVVDLAPDATYARAILLFDGRDDAEVTAARGQWARLKALGFALAYWQQTEEGRWERKM